PDYHDGIVQGTLSLLQELFRATSQDQCTCLGTRTTSKEVVSVSSKLFLSEERRVTQNLRREVPR
ncbi:hypothetical protein NL321_30145, partial [Klebsiella pneumoniae]|nr:hypothetical protein [Klebsiella pneumoniae]